MHMWLRCAAQLGNHGIGAAPDHFSPQKDIAGLDLYIYIEGLNG